MPKNYDIRVTQTCAFDVIVLNVVSDMLSQVPLQTFLIFWRDGGWWGGGGGGGGAHTGAEILVNPCRAKYPLTSSCQLCLRSLIQYPESSRPRYEVLWSGSTGPWPRVSCVVCASEDRSDSDCRPTADAGATTCEAAAYCCALATNPPICSWPSLCLWIDLQLRQCS